MIPHHAWNPLDPMIVMTEEQTLGIQICIFSASARRTTRRFGTYYMSQWKKHISPYMSQRVDPCGSMWRSLFARPSDKVRLDSRNS